MPQTPDKFDFSGLSIAERILLVESLWDSIARDSQADIPLTQEQKHELTRRLAAEEAGEITYSSWQEAKRRLLSEK